MLGHEHVISLFSQAQLLSFVFLKNILEDNEILVFSRVNFQKAVENMEAIFKGTAEKLLIQCVNIWNRE